MTENDLMNICSGFVRGEMGGTVSKGAAGGGKASRRPVMLQSIFEAEWQRPRERIACSCFLHVFWQFCGPLNHPKPGWPARPRHSGQPGWAARPRASCSIGGGRGRTRWTASLGFAPSHSGQPRWAARPRHGGQPGWAARPRGGRPSWAASPRNGAQTGWAARPRAAGTLVGGRVSAAGSLDGGRALGTARGLAGRRAPERRATSFGGAPPAPRLRGFPWCPEVAPQCGRHGGSMWALCRRAERPWPPDAARRADGRGEWWSLVFRSAGQLFFPPCRAFL